MQKTILFIISIIMLYACCHPVKTDDKPVSKTPEYTAPEKELNNANGNFAGMCVEKGIKEAFMSYAAGNAILMKEGSAPVIGIDSIGLYLSQGKVAHKMNFQTDRIEVSASNDLGYIFGSFNASVVGKDGREKSKEGYYTSVWHKQSDGTWKFVLFTMVSNTSK